LLGALLVGEVFEGSGNHIRKIFKAKNRYEGESSRGSHVSLSKKRSSSSQRTRPLLPRDLLSSGEGEAFQDPVNPGRTAKPGWEVSAYVQPGKRPEEVSLSL